MPLTLKAAHWIKGIDDNSFVLLSTGALARGWVSKEIGETDGPLGTVALAMTLWKLKKITPIILIESTLTHTIIPILKSVGFKIIALKDAIKLNDTKKDGLDQIACVVPLSSNPDEIRRTNRQLFNCIDPAMVVCIEKTGPNINGVFHNMKGFDYSEGYARVDLVVNQAMRLGIPTLGIGDGGNEIGMSMVSDSVRKFIPYGDKCQCGCGGGIAPTAKTDMLITSAVSNWGCYALCAALALMENRIDLIHTAEIEMKMLDVAIKSDNVDGVTGQLSMTVDGLSNECNLAVIGLLCDLVIKELKGDNSDVDINCISKGPTLNVRI